MMAASFWLSARSLFLINNTVCPLANLLHQTCIVCLVKHFVTVHWMHLSVNGIRAVPRGMLLMAMLPFNVYYLYPMSK